VAAEENNSARDVRLCVCLLCYLLGFCFVV
jgi:hypothetical protein